MSVSLPAHPNLEHLKAQAKDLLVAFRVGDAEAIARIAPYFPASTPRFCLNQAQLVIAREYGFESWVKLKTQVELAAASSLAEQANAFVELAMQREQTIAAVAMLGANSSIGAASFSAACASGNATMVDIFLRENPALLNAKISPKDWEPLLYVCYSNLLKDQSFRPQLIETARLLIERGANVNAAWYAPEWDSQEACLYGATGVNNCPALAEILLNAGAEPDDGESMYHATELPEWTCLKLLLEYGGPLNSHNVLAHLLDREEPEWLKMMLSYAKGPSDIPAVLPFALRRGRSAECFRVLIDSGMDLNAPDFGQGNLTPYQVATRLGRTDVTKMLEDAGAELTLSDADRIIGDLARGEKIDPAAISPEIIAELDNETPTPTIAVLGERGSDAALNVLLAAGANPNVTDGNGWTGLIHASLHGRLSTVLIFLKHGADPNIRDRVHKGNASGFAAHNSQYQDSSSMQNYVAIVEALIAAGCELPEKAWGSPEVQAVFVKHGAKPA